MSKLTRLPICELLRIAVDNLLGGAVKQMTDRVKNGEKPAFALVEATLYPAEIMKTGRGDSCAERSKPVRLASPKIGRNDLCPCGSGEKFKRCCEGRFVETVPVSSDRGAIQIDSV